MAFIKLWVLILFVLAAADDQMGVVEAQYYPGVCFGRRGDNLPPASQVVVLYKQYGIGNMRLFNPDPDVLTALENKGIELTPGRAKSRSSQLGGHQCSKGMVRYSRVWLIYNFFWLNIDI